MRGLCATTGVSPWYGILSFANGLYGFDVVAGGARCRGAVR